MMHSQILFAKIGWDELYNGREPSFGNFSAPRQSSEWYERFNFKDINGQVFGHIPPISGSSDRLNGQLTRCSSSRCIALREIGGA
jgi:hypothetical protein